MKEKQTLAYEIEKFLSGKVLYPFLFGAHFVLSLYALNFHEIYFRQVARSLVIVVGFITIFYYLTRFLIGRNYSGLLTFFLSITVLTTNIQFNLLNAVYPGELLGLSFHRTIFFGIAALNLAVASSVLYLAYSNVLDLKKTTKFLNAFALILIAGVIFQIGLNLQYNQHDFDQINLEPRKNNSGTPSIYYIITDKYTSSEVLSEQYNFNNTRFHKSMESKGFNVVKNFYTNYDETYASLASSLNLDYLQNMGVTASTSQKQVYSLLDDYVVQDFLRDQGYRYYHIGGGYTRFNKNADKSYFFFRDYFGDKISLNRFERIIFEKTIFHKTSSIKTHTYANRKSYEAISTISEKDGKKFVFAHIMSPHRPYTLPKTVDSVKFYQKSEAPRKKRYVQEVKATNIWLNRVVEDIIENEKNAIILIQGDEGPGLNKSHFTEEQNIRRDHSVMFAHYTPSVPDEEFEKNVNPVNLFRVIFNNYFDQNLPMKKGKTYTVDSGKNLKFYDENLSIVLNSTEAIDR